MEAANSSMYSNEAISSAKVNGSLASEVTLSRESTWTICKASEAVVVFLLPFPTALKKPKYYFKVKSDIHTC